MTGLLLFTVSALYLGVAINYLVTGNVGLCIAFAAYAVANVGIWMAGGS